MAQISMSVEHNESLESMPCQRSPDIDHERFESVRLQRKRSGKIYCRPRDPIRDCRRDDDLIALRLQLRRRSLGVSFGGKGVETQRKMGPVFLDDSDGKNHQRFA